MADQGSEVFEQAKGLAVRQQLQRTLELVNRALDKMASGTYGVCERCKQAIDPARLKAQPHAFLPERGKGGDLIDQGSAQAGDVNDHGARHAGSFRWLRIYPSQMPLQEQGIARA